MSEIKTFNLGNIDEIIEASHNYNALSDLLDQQANELYLLNNSIDMDAFSKLNYNDNCNLF